jgi:hypothetical protein
LSLGWVAVEILRHADDGFSGPPLWIWAACPAVVLVMVAIATVVPARWALAVNPLALARRN